MPRDSRAPPPGGALAIVGLVRDCESTLEPALDRLAAALPPGRTALWCVVESDSDDGSAALLARLARERPGFTGLSLGRLRDRMPARTARIAHCRNAYLDWLRAAAAATPIDHVVVADLDGIIDRLDASALASCWTRDDWTVCTANVDGPYYDIWALRHPDWCPGDCWREADFLARLGGNADRARHAAVFARMVPIPPDADWLEVDSAFGGLAIYRTEALLGARYVGLSADGREVCEHVALHAQIRAAGGRIFINPRLLASSGASTVDYWPERQLLATKVDGLAFRAVLRMFLGRDTARGVRRLLNTLT